MTHAFNMSGCLGASFHKRIDKGGLYQSSLSRAGAIVTFQSWSGEYQVCVREAYLKKRKILQVNSL
jgi:hypothetical protein